MSFLVWQSKKIYCRDLGHYIFAVRIVVSCLKTTPIWYTCHREISPLRWFAYHEPQTRPIDIVYIKGPRLTNHPEKFLKQRLSKRYMGQTMQPTVQMESNVCQSSTLTSQPVA